MTSGFQRALEELYGLERRKNKLGLAGTRMLLASLGDPHLRFRSVHVAGTNGKGSTAALIERVLREQGFRTGLFTSPHLVDFRERIRVSGRWVDQDWLEAMLARMREMPEGRDRTFFEVATALGFAWFAEQKVEIAVVEVGLGGRLDTTNVITPEVSVITSIGLDHTEILGDTIEAIAAEKAGIVKPGVPVVTGVTGDPARRVIERIAAGHGAPVVSAGHVPEAAPGERTFTSFHVALARETLGVLASRGFPTTSRAFDAGVALTRWPGRMERCPALPRLWWDGAHNADGARTLDRLRDLEPTVGAIVLALSRDKDAGTFLDELRRIFPTASLIATRTRSERAMEPAAIAATARARGFDATEAADIPSAVRQALEFAGQAPVLLTGSLFAVGEAMESFGGAPGEAQ